MKTYMVTVPIPEPKSNRDSGLKSGSLCCISANIDCITLYSGAKRDNKYWWHTCLLLKSIAAQLYVF